MPGAGPAGADLSGADLSGAGPGGAGPGGAGRGGTGSAGAGPGGVGPAGSGPGGGAVVGEGVPGRLLPADRIAAIVHDGLAGLDLDGARMVLLVPDSTRSAPTGDMVRLVHAAVGGRVASLEVLVALGTHPAMTEAQLATMLGPVPAGVRVDNHRWWDPATFADLGTVPAARVAAISGGLLAEDVPVRVNRAVAEADVVLICGPVFPHEVVGFSGGTKYLFPGVSGPEVIDVSHWLGALLTSSAIIGRPGTTPVRALIDAAADLVPARQLCLALVVGPDGDGLAGLWCGPPRPAWAAAAALSAQVHVTYLDRPYRRVLSLVSGRYGDLWTAAKGMYKVEPVVADGGQVVVHAPHVTQFSATHGRELAEVGYHCRDYFLGQWERYRHRSRAVLAHSTHVRGTGGWDPGAGERCRIDVALATGIPADLVRDHALRAVDPGTVDPVRWAADPDTLVVPNAGERLYRLRG